MTFLSLLPTHMFEGSKFMWFSVVETLALATGISVALLGGMPGSATPEYSITEKNHHKGDFLILHNIKLYQQPHSRK